MTFRLVAERLTDAEVYLRPTHVLDVPGWGVVANTADLARLFGCTRAWVTKVLESGVTGVE